MPSYLPLGKDRDGILPSIHLALTMTAELPPSFNPPAIMTALLPSPMRGIKNDAIFQHCMSAASLLTPHSKNPS
ncbi:MAG: hypothetical protein J1E06_01985 [Acutalibacter sp.]|nr:hypothetical protein [Acutalibacter sp.]